MNDFQDTAQPDLPYPTCALKKDLAAQFDEVQLSNFAFMAGIVYAYENQMWGVYLFVWDDALI